MAESSKLLDDVTQWTSNDFAQRWREILPSLITSLQFSRLLSAVKEELSRCLAKEFQSSTTENVIINRLSQSCLDILDCVTSCVDYLLGCGTPMSLTDLYLLLSCALSLLDTSYNSCKEIGTCYKKPTNPFSEHLSAIFRKSFHLQTILCDYFDALDCSSVNDHEADDLEPIVSKMATLCIPVSLLDVKAMICLWKTVSRMMCVHKEVLKRRIDICSVISSLVEIISHSCSYLEELSVNSVSGPTATAIKLVSFLMKVVITLCRNYVDYIVGACCEKLVQLALRLHSLLLDKEECCNTQDSSEGTSIYELTRCQIGVALQPFADIMINNKDFIICLTTKQQQDSSTAIHRLMLLLNIVTALPHQSDETWTFCIVASNYPEDIPRQNVLEAIFDCVPQCYMKFYLPLYLPGSMFEGRPQRWVSLYEHVCTQLCSLAACFPATLFCHLEKCLLVNVLSSSMHTALLAMDIWCFIARLGSADLCRDHCFFLIDVLRKMSLRRDRRTPTTPQISHLVMIIRRLFRLMAEVHQGELLLHLATLSASPDCASSSTIEQLYTMDIFILLPLSSLVTPIPPVWIDIVDSLTVGYYQQIVDWCNGISRAEQDGKTLVNISELNSLLASLTSIYQSLTHIIPSCAPSSNLPLSTGLDRLPSAMNEQQSDNDHIMKSIAYHKTRITKLCQQLITILFNSSRAYSVDNNVDNRLAFSRFIDLVSAISSSLKESSIAQILHICCVLTGGNCDNTEDFLQLSMNKFLRTLASRSLHSEVRSGEMDLGLLEILPIFCRSLLKTSHPVAQLAALEQFTHFAQHTVHESVVIATLDNNKDNNENVNNNVVEYIKQISSDEGGLSERRQNSLQTIRDQFVVVDCWLSNISLETINSTSEEVMDQVNCSQLNESQSSIDPPMSKKMRPGSDTMDDSCINSNKIYDETELRKSLVALENSVEMLRSTYDTSRLPLPLWAVQYLQSIRNKLSTLV